MGSRPIRTSLTDGVYRICLTRPERRNALDDGLVAALQEAFTQAGGDPAVRVIVLEAEGPDFCAGADLAETLAQVTERGPVENLANAQRLGDLFVTMRRLDRVIVGAVRGRALAGGAGLATACDIVLMADDAELGYPEVHLGLVPAMVGAILRRAVGEKAGFELLARGHRIDAREAHRLGLVTRVVPAGDLAAEVATVAAELAGRPGGALTLIKRLYYGQDGLSFEDAIGRGAEVNILARGTADAREGLTRFLARRGGRPA